MVQPGNTIYEITGPDDYQIWKVEDVMVPDEDHFWTALLVGGTDRMAVNAEALTDALGSDHPRWQCLNPRFRGPTDKIWAADAVPPKTVDEEPRRVLERVLAPRKASRLRFQQESGRGSRSEIINPFLEGYDGCVFHQLGSVVGWKAAFTARHPKTDDIVSAIVLSRPKARMIDDGSTIEISRIANHPVAPKNTSSWIVAKARDWAESEGYDQVVSYSGVADNPGTTYKAAGFENDRTVAADGDGWKTHDGDRKEYHDGNSWERRRWVYDLSPS